MQPPWRVHVLGDLYWPSYTQIIIALEFIKQLETIGCPVTFRFNLSDSILFAGLGKSVHANAACAIKEIEKLITSPKTGASNLTVWGLRLIGLPPVGSDVSLRREHLLLDKQAWGCREMLNYLQIEEPNLANSGPFGNILHTSTDFFRSVPPAAIAALNAGEYYSAIVQAVENIRPMPSLISVIDSNHSIEPHFRSPVEAIVDACDSQTTDDMLRATIQSEGIHDFDFQAVNAEGETYDCELIAEHFVDPPQSLDEAIHRLTTISTIRQVLTTEEVGVVQRLGRIESDIPKKTRATNASYKRFQDARNFIPSKRAKAIRLGLELRQLSDKQFSYRSMRKELAKSIRALDHEYQSQLSRLTGLLSVLDRLRRKGRVTERHDLFFFNGVDAAFPDLLTLPALDHDRKVQVLAAQATMVSVEGIKFILDGKTNTAEELARLCIGKAHRPGAWPGAIALHARRESTVQFLPREIRLKLLQLNSTKVWLLCRMATTI